MSELLKSSDSQNYLRERMQALVGVEKNPLSIEELLHRLKPLSPIEYVSKDSPPVFLMHMGPTDAFWPGDTRLKWDVHTPITGLILAKKLKMLGVPHELILVPETQGRGDVGVFLARELAFLRKHLSITDVIQDGNQSPSANR
jgi:hypothetical protein